MNILFEWIQKYLIILTNLKPHTYFLYFLLRVLLNLLFCLGGFLLIVAKAAKSEEVCHITNHFLI